jgi:tetratricopeptide (TPR) repeat protein
MSSPSATAVPRLHGLAQTVIPHVVAAAQALEAGRVDEAGRALGGALAAHPRHPEVLRLQAGIHSLRGQHQDAIGAMRSAVAQRPRDALYVNTLGTVLAAAGDLDGAIAAFRRSCEMQPDAAIAWFNLGILLTRSVRHDEAIVALRRAVALAPGHVAARALLADMLRVSGRPDEAAAEYRRIIAEHACAGMAWWGLADLKTVKFHADDIEQMRVAMRTPNASDDDLIAIGFALAKALDDAGRYAESLAALADANAIARRRKTWNASAFSTEISAILDAFTPAPAGASATLGSGVIFIVSLPRSGSTLVEQILASHPEVEGAGELADLPQVLAEESRRRGLAFPQWVGAMQAPDWERLGRRYLERTAHWTRRRRMFTDKLPNNWYYIGAIRAMLPAARIIVCRRDPLETCLSCYRQHLDNNEYTRTFADVAGFWRDFDRSIRHALPMHTEALHENALETLVADPEAQIRRLLDFCGLPFDPACLDFHRTERDVRSPSAMQVRQPLRHDTARAPRYGALLDPLRAALGMPPFAAAVPVQAQAAQRSERDWVEQVQRIVLRGDSAATEALLSTALAEHPDSAQLRRARAGVLLQTQRRTQAEALLRAVLADHPDDAASAFLLARMLRDDGRMSAAAAVLRACFEHGQHDSGLAIQAIELADDCGSKQDAAAIAERAIASHPDDPRLHAYAGMLELQLGDFERARQHYLFALEYGTQACEWHIPHGLVNTQRYQQIDHPDFARLRTCLERTDLSDRARSTLLFALGKMHDDVGAYAEAARFFRAGNAIAHALTRWSREDWQRAVSALLGARPIAQRLDTPGDFVPVFIVGMPRSGTTLAAELLARYPRVRNRGELAWLPRLAQTAELAIAPDRAALERARATCTLHLRGDESDARWFIDKQPLNFRYVDLILALWPNAKIIHCRRSPRDTALSLWMQSFLEDLQGYAYDFSDIAVVMQDCERLMAHWQTLHGPSIRSVRYEHLATDPTGTIADLARWLELPVEEADTRASTASVSISTASLWQARQPVYTRAIGRWRNYAAYVPELLEFPE